MSCPSGRHQHMSVAIRPTVHQSKPSPLTRAGPGAEQGSGVCRWPVTALPPGPGSTSGLPQFPSFLPSSLLPHLHTQAFGPQLLSGPSFNMLPFLFCSFLSDFPDFRCPWWGTGDRRPGDPAQGGIGPTAPRARDTLLTFCSTCRPPAPLSPRL